MSDRGARLGIPLIVLAVTAAVYLPVLTFQFVCDDEQQIIWNQPYFAWRALPHYFTTDIWSHITGFHSNYYRPLFMVWLMLNSKLFGLDSGLWHLSALAAHVAATLVFYFLARRLVRDRMAAGAAALLFGLHPAHVEAVAWISGATESIFALLAFGMLLCHIRGREAPAAEARRWQLASLGLFGMAMLAKETAIVLPFVLIGYDCIFPPQETDKLGQRWRNALRAAVPYGAVVLIYLALRIHALKALAPASRPWTVSMVLETWPFVLVFYLKQLLAPFQFSLFYPILPVKQPGLMNFALPLLAVIAAGLTLVWISRRSRVAAFAALLVVIPILPVLNLKAFAFDDFLHDRYLYVPAAGLCILLALGWQRLPAGWLRLAVLALVSVLLAGSTLRASRIWENNLALYSRAVDIAPESVMAQIYLGEELLRLDRSADALPVLKKALAGYPGDYDLHDDIAMCYAQLGQYDEARGYFEEAIRLQPQSPQAYRNLAALEYSAGKLDDAEGHVRRALAVRRVSGPGRSGYHRLLGWILERKADLQGALAEYQAELRENPGAEDVRNNVQLLSAKLGVQ